MKPATVQRDLASPCARGAALLLLLSLLLSLVSCGSEPPVVTEGLTVLREPTLPISGEARLLGEEVLLSLFLYAAEEWLGRSPAAGTQRQIEEHALETAARLAECGITEEAYLAVLALLERDGEAAVDEWIAGSEEGYPHLRALYLALTAHLPSDRLTSLGYDLLLYSYDFRCDTAKRRYETYGKTHPYLEDEYEAIVAERAAFISEVGEESFSAALRTLLMLSDLFAEADGKTDKLKDFTPAELLIFLDYLPLEELFVSTEGNRVLLSLAASERGGGIGYLLAVAEECGDLPVLAAEMEGLLTLAIHLRDAMGREEAILLGEGERAALLSALFAKLPEEDWAYLASLPTLPLDRETYDRRARSKWGADYEAYAAATTPITVDELRAAAGGEGFSEALSRYLAAVTPVLSYLIQPE